MKKKKPAKKAKKAIRRRASDRVPARRRPLGSTASGSSLAEPLPPSPGPWARHLDLVLVLSAPDAAGHRKAIVDCETSSAPDMPQGEREANARLIAAAPELLAALKLAIAVDAAFRREHGDAIRTPEYQDSYDVALAAIANAEGR